MKTLAIVPQLRNSVLEWPSSESRVLYQSARLEIDPAAIAESANVARLSFRSLYEALRDPEIDLMEIAEPMWITEWPRHFAIAALARVARFRLPRLTIATYAIENLDWRERFAHPNLQRWPNLQRAFARLLRSITDHTASRLLDLIVFGTPGAAGNYADTLPLTLRKVEKSVLYDSFEICECVSYSDPDPDLETEYRVQFLGENTQRKGVDVLLRAWKQLDKEWTATRDRVLLVSGPGFTSDSELKRVKFEPRLQRDEVYDRLVQADVVVLPSRRTARWREQQGLPVIEGLQHGCAIVMSSESGLVPLLKGRHDVFVVPPEDSEGLAAALLAAYSLKGRSRNRDPHVAHVDRLRERLWVHMREMQPRAARGQ